jgi:hypothetical protein
MMRRFAPSTLVILLAVLCLAPLAAWADHGEYFETYGYFTAAKGELEIELWNEFFSSRRQDTEEEHAGHQLSIEYGITDRWMAEIYAELHDNPTGQGLQYTRTKLETRYRLGDYSRKGINTALYLEYEKSALAAESDELEGKIILSKDFGDLNLSANAIFARDLERGAKLEFGYAAGLSYPVSRKMILSVETLVRPSDRQVFIIPGVHFSLGKQDWMGVGVSLQTSPAPFNATLRTFWGHEF